MGHEPDPPLSLDADKALLRAWCRGDKTAGERLIRHHFEWVTRLVLRWVRGDSAAAMDIVQATFEVAVMKKAEIRGAMGPYVRGTARVKLLEYLRRQDAVVQELTTSLRESASGAESVLLDEEQEHLAIRALRRLPPEQQDLMYLRYVQRMKLRELAELRDMTVGQVDGILRRAEQRLGHEVEHLARSLDLGQSTLVGVETWMRRHEDGRDSSR